MRQGGVSLAYLRRFITDSGESLTPPIFQEGDGWGGVGWGCSCLSYIS